APAGVTFKSLPDGSFLMGGDNPPAGSYQLEAKTDVREITGFRLETLPHPDLPNHGCGRSSNGGFMVSEVQVFVPGQSGFERKKVTAADADVQQPEFPANALTDENPKTHWGVMPGDGKAHWAVVALD